jgi:hypothetical protein
MYKKTKGDPMSLPENLQKALENVKENPKDEKDFIELWSRQSNITAVELILKRDGLNIEDYSLDEVMKFGRMCAERITSYLKDGAPKYPHLVDTSAISIKTLKRFEELFELRDKAVEAKDELTEKAVYDGMKPLLRQFWKEETEPTEWEEVLVFTHITHFKANLGKN